MEEYLRNQTGFLPESASLKQRFYCVKNQISEMPLCPVCSSPTPWNQYLNAFNQFCGVRCFNISMRGESGRKRACSRNQFKKIEARDLPTLLSKLTRRDGKINGNLTNEKHLTHEQIAMLHLHTRDYPEEFSISSRVMILANKLSLGDLTCANCSKIFEPSNDKKRYCSVECSNKHTDKIDKTKTANLTKYGVTSNLVHGVISPETQARILNGEVGELYLSGLTVPEIAKNLNISDSRTHVLLNKWATSEGVEIQKRSYSYLQKRIADALRERNIDFLEGSRSIIPPYEVDFYLPQHRIAIEINGIYWHSEKFKDRDYHEKKCNMAREQNVHLMQFWETEINNNFDLVISMIDQNRKSIYARNCKIGTPTSAQHLEFLNQNHIQGWVNARVKLGLWFGDELVAIMTFGSPRFSNDAPWELLRFASLRGHRVVGGFSKLLQHFTQNHSGDVISYAHKRLSNFANVYEKCGFEKLRETPPSYTYYHAEKPSISRYKAQKHKLSKLLGDKYCPSETERANMNRNQYYRVWDAGQIVYRYRNTNT